MLCGRHSSILKLKYTTTDTTLDYSKPNDDTVRLMHNPSGGLVGALIHEITTSLQEKTKYNTTKQYKFTVTKRKQYLVVAYTKAMQR